MKILKFIGKGLAAIFFIALVFIDRLVMSFFIRRDIPGISEIMKFEHEKELLAIRTFWYGVISAIILFVIIFFYIV